MNKDYNERLWRKLAQGYSDQHGEELQQELRALEQSGATYLTPKLDRKIRRMLRDKRRKQRLQTLVAAAACIAILLLVPQMGRLERDAPSEAPAAELPAEYQVLPLAVTLPENLTVSGYEQDLEKTIYYLDDAFRDNIVLTLEYIPDQSDWGGFTPVEINGSEAYALSTGDYNLLAFEKDRLRYTLTCRHDINTLIGLGRTVL